MANANIYDFADTWNDAGTLNGIKLTVTDTLSGAGSNLLNLAIASGASIVGSKAAVLTLNDGGGNSLALSPTASTTRTNLGLGTIATQAASAVAITGGTVSGLTSLALAAAADANPISLTGYSLTGSNAQSLVDLAGTWNTSGTPTAIKLNITNTASNASSKLLDLQVGGTTKVNVGVDGIIRGPSGTGFIDLVAGGGTFGTFGWNGTSAIQFTASAVNFTPTALRMGEPSYTYLCVDAANALALRNSTNAQTFSIYNTWTNSTNYERLSQSWSSNVLYTGAEPGSGGGTKRLQVDFGGAEKALSDGVATGFVRIACANDIAIAGVIHYGVYAKDASDDIQVRSGSVNFAIVNKAGAGVTTCTLGTVLNEAVAVSAGTLTVAFTEDATAGSTVDILANAVSSLTETSLDIRYRVEIFGPKQTVTPL